MLRLYLLGLLLFVGVSLSAQIPTFKVRYGTGSNDEARFVTVLSDNSFIVAGSSAGGGLGGTDAMLVKFSANGAVEWSQVYGGSGNDLFKFILACSDGNFIAVGETNSFGAGSTDIYVVKFDINGNILWERTCGGSGIETGSGISEASDGYLISGGTQSFGGGFWNVFVEKLDFNGDSQWSRAWGTGGGDVGGYTLSAANGDIWVVGFWFAGSNNHDAILFRLNSNGILQNAIRVGVNNNDNTMCLIPGGAGMTAAGTSFSYTNGAIAHPWIISYNAGQLIWRALPGVVFQVDNPDVCPGNCRTITATFTGMPPFTLTVNNPFTGDFTNTFNSNTGSFQICPPPGTTPGYFTAQAVALTDAFCACP